MRNYNSWGRGIFLFSWVRSGRCWNTLCWISFCRKHGRWKMYLLGMYEGNSIALNVSALPPFLCKVHVLCVLFFEILGYFFGISLYLCSPDEDFSSHIVLLHCVLLHCLWRKQPVWCQAAPSWLSARDGSVSPPNMTKMATWRKIWTKIFRQFNTIS